MYFYIKNYSSIANHSFFNFFYVFSSTTHNYRAVNSLLLKLLNYLVLSKLD